MKRLALIFLVVAIFATVSLGATEVSLSGNFEYGLITNRKDCITETMAESETTISALVSEFVTLGTTFIINPDTAVLDDLSVTADVGAWFELPIGYVVMVSAFGSAENDIDGLSILHFDFDFEFDPAKKQIYAGIVATPIPISIGCYYDSNGSDIGDSLVGGSLGFFMDPIAISGGAEYDLLDKNYSYDASASIGLDTICFGASLDGSKESAIDAVFLDFDVVNIGGLDIVFNVNLEEEKQLRGTDVSAYITINVINFRLGHLFTEFGEGDENAPAAPPNGGVYAKVEVSY